MYQKEITRDSNIMSGIEECIEGEKDSPVSPVSPCFPQHKVNASVPPIKPQKTESEKEISASIEKLTQELNKMKENTEENEDYNTVVIKEYEQDIKALEIEVEKERKEKERVLHLNDQLHSQISNLKYEVNKQNALLQNLKKKTEPPAKNENPAQIFKEIIEQVQKVIGDSEILQESIKEVNEKLENKKLVYENPKQLATYLIGTILAKNAAKNQEKTQNFNENSSLNIEKINRVHEIMKNNFVALDTDIKNHKSVISDQMARQEKSMETIRTGMAKLNKSIQFYKKKLSEQQFIYAKEINSLQSEKNVLMREHGLAMSMTSELQELRNANNEIPLLQSKINELEEELQKAQKSLQYRNSIRKMSPEYDIANISVQENVEILQYYKDQIAKEKQLIDYSTQDLNLKKKEMRELSLELQMKNRKIRTIQSELREIKERYYAPTTAYKIISVSLFCLVIILLYSHIARSTYSF